ncbi:MAG TPA: MFS transporter [Bryobacteraceae bacterium]|nr:MFS transporter [Bryobacteraceae bacterium]
MRVPAQRESRVGAATRSRRISAPTIVLSLLCAMYLILFVDRVNIGTAAPLIKLDLHLSNTQLGLVFSAFAIPYAIFQLLGSWIGDKFGPRLILTACCAIVGVATILTGVAGGFLSLIAARLALGLGEGAAFSTATRAMSTWTPAGRWGFAQGIVHSFAHIGNALTPPLMIALFALITWRGSFVAMGSASLIWLGVWAWYFRDDPRKHSAITQADLATLPARATGSRPSVPWLRLARRILPVTAVDFCYGWTLWLFMSWIPTFFLENYHLNLKSSAMFTSGVLFAGVIGDTVGGVLSDRLLRKTGSLVIARRSVIVAGFLGAFVFMLPVVLIHDLKTAAVCLSLAFFCAELIVAPIWSVPMDIAPRYAGTASGMMNTGFAVAGLVSPSSFGYLVDLTGSWVIPFIASVVLLFCGAILALRLRPDKPFEEL